MRLVQRAYSLVKHIANLFYRQYLAIRTLHPPPRSHKERITFFTTGTVSYLTKWNDSGTVYNFFPVKQSSLKMKATRNNSDTFASYTYVTRCEKPAPRVKNLGAH